MKNNFAQFEVGRTPKKKLYAYLEGSGVTRVALIANPQGNDFLVLGVPVQDWWHATCTFAARAEEESYIRLLLPVDEHGQCTADSYADLMSCLTPEQVWDEGGDVELNRLFSYTVGSRRRSPATKNRYSTTISAAMPNWARDIRQDKLFYHRVLIRIGHIPWDFDKTHWIEGFISSFGSRVGLYPHSFSLERNLNATLRVRLAPICSGSFARPALWVMGYLSPIVQNLNSLCSAMNRKIC